MGVAVGAFVPITEVFCDAMVVDNASSVFKIGRFEFSPEIGGNEGIRNVAGTRATRELCRSLVEFDRDFSRNTSSSPKPLSLTRSTHNFHKDLSDF